MRGSDWLESIKACSADSVVSLIEFSGLSGTSSFELSSSLFSAFSSVVISPCSISLSLGLSMSSLFGEVGSSVTASIPVSSFSLSFSMFSSYSLSALLTEFTCKLSGDLKIFRSNVGGYLSAFRI